MRVTSASSACCASIVNVTSVDFVATIVAATVVLRRRRRICPHCTHKTRFRYDTRPVQSRWRHLDLGVWRVELRAVILNAVEHGTSNARVEGLNTTVRLLVRRPTASIPLTPPLP